MQSMKETIRQILEARDREFEDVMRAFPNFPDIERAFESFSVAQKIGTPVHVRVPKRFNVIN